MGTLQVGYGWRHVEACTGWNRVRLRRAVRAGLVRPSIHESAKGASSDPHVWSFEDLVRLRVIAGLKDAHVPTLLIAEVVRRLEDLDPDDPPALVVRVSDGHLTLDVSKAVEDVRRALDGQEGERVAS